MADTQMLPTFLRCLLLLTSHSCKCWMGQFVHSHVPVILMKTFIKYWDSRMKASRFFFFFFSFPKVRFVVVVCFCSWKLDSCLACLPCCKTQNTCMYTIQFLSICVHYACLKIKYFYQISLFTQILPHSQVISIYYPVERGGE